MGENGQHPERERWLIHLVITRDCTTEPVPSEWPWEAWFPGGDPMVLRTLRVGIDAIPYEVMSQEQQEEPCSPVQSSLGLPS